MKIVVIGGAGRIGSMVVAVLTEQGHETVPASPRLGVNTVTGVGLAETLAGASVLVDVSNPPDGGGQTPFEFFERSTRNLLAAEGSAGVRHHVALSIVGTPTLAENGDPRASGGYFQAKLAQEQLVQASMIPYTIVRATQFYEFIGTIADASTAAGSVRLPPVRFQPMAAEDAARAVVRAAVGTPVNGIVEVGGPEQFRFDEIVRRVLAAGEDPRVVVSDPDARYFGIPLGERSLVPGPGATIGEIRIDEWLHQRSAS